MSVFEYNGQQRILQTFSFLLVYCIMLKITLLLIYD